MMYIYSMFLSSTLYVTTTVQWDTLMEVLLIVGFGNSSFYRLRNITDSKESTKLHSFNWPQITTVIHSDVISSFPQHISRKL